jgi:hypothetical protein
MDRITAARARIDQAQDLPDLLTTAFTAFQDMLQVLEHHLERDDGTFAAFILSATAAANGRDRIAAAPSLPPAVITAFYARPEPQAESLLADATVIHVAITVAGLSTQLAGRLEAAARSSAMPADRDACAHAARHASRILALLGGAREP